MHLCKQLGSHGHSAAPVREAGLRNSDDGSSWHPAISGSWIVVTKDEDFVERCVGNPFAPAVVWLRIGNCINGVFFARIEPRPPEVIRLLKLGERLVEVR